MRSDGAHGVLTAPAGVALLDEQLFLAVACISKQVVKETLLLYEIKLEQYSGFHELMDSDIIQSGNLSFC